MRVLILLIFLLSIYGCKKDEPLNDYGNGQVNCTYGDYDIQGKVTDSLSDTPIIGAKIEFSGIAFDPVYSSKLGNYYTHWRICLISKYHIWKDSHVIHYYVLQDSMAFLDDFTIGELRANQPLVKDIQLNRLGYIRFNIDDTSANYESKLNDIELFLQDTNLNIINADTAVVLSTFPYYKQQLRWNTYNDIFGNQYFSDSLQAIANDTIDYYIYY